MRTLVPFRLDSIPFWILLNDGVHITNMCGSVDVSKMRMVPLIRGL
jgi:hypothetical protein